MSNQNEFKINDKPSSVGFFLNADENDCAITIQTEQNRLLGLTYTDTQKLINKLNEALKSFDLIQIKK